MIKLAILSILVLGCVHATPVASPTPPVAPLPNRVCAMIKLNDPETKCSETGEHPRERDVARVEIDGGVKYCWETFDEAKPVGCATIVLSKGETAQRAVAQERERAKQEAEAKAKAEVDKAKPEPKSEPKPAEVKPADPHAKPSKPDPKKP